MADVVQVDRADGIAIVTICRPPVNALNGEVLERIAGAFAELDEDAAVAAVVVRGDGERAFVAGADINQFTGLDRDGAVQLSRAFQVSLDRVATCSKPVVAAIRGFCLGGGLELALACDLRIAGEGAQLGLPEIKLGLLPGGGGTQRLPRLIGPGRARLLYLTGEPIAASIAYGWGLVEQVVPDDDVDAAASTVARTLARLSPRAIGRLKGLALRTADADFVEGLEQEAEAFGDGVVDVDGREGVAAFLEKRQAQWSTALEGGGTQ